MSELFKNDRLFWMFVVWCVAFLVVLIEMEAWSLFPEWGMAFKQSVRAALGF